jgi:hypothetical protein
MMNLRSGRNEVLALIGESVADHQVVDSLLKVGSFGFVWNCQEEGLLIVCFGIVCFVASMLEFKRFLFVALG